MNDEFLPGRQQVQGILFRLLLGLFFVVNVHRVFLLGSRLLLGLFGLGLLLLLWRRLLGCKNINLELERYSIPSKTSAFSQRGTSPMTDLNLLWLTHVKNQRVTFGYGARNDASNKRM